MIIWINGTSGAGKSSAARELLDLLPGSVHFDPELVGTALRLLLPEKRLGEVRDYQDVPAWRRLLVDSAAAMLTEVTGPVVVPMELLRQDYRDEIFGGLAARGVSVHHILLHCEETILRERITGGGTECVDPAVVESPRRRSPDGFAAYQASLAWLAADAYLIDTSVLTPRQTAERIAVLARTGEAAREIVQTPAPTGATLAAGVLLFDERDRVLLVDPTYKPGWEFPGGVVEAGEPPARAGMREVEEELGVALPVPPRLLVVDWEPARPPGFGGLRLLFDGGRLNADSRSALRLPGDELRDWRFVTEQEAEGMLPPVRQARLRWALRAREKGTVFNLEAGTPVGPTP